MLKKLHISFFKVLVLGVLGFVLGLSNPVQGTDLVKAWEVLEEANEATLKNNFSELKRISESLGEIKQVGGYKHWEYRIQIVLSDAKTPKSIGTFIKGERLEIISKSSKIYGGNIVSLHKTKTTTVTGILEDVNQVRCRGINNKQLNGLTKTGENVGGINTLFSPRWGEIQSKYKHIRDAEMI